MSYNILNFDGKVVASNRCLHDSNVGYEADFSTNGSVDGWTYFNGIHTYGCWNNFLFGTLYGDYALVGRHNVFASIEAENFYTLRLVMKLNFVERTGTQVVPAYGRIMWRTLANPIWDTDKQLDFEIFNDTEWHTYFISLAGAQWWQGDINDLRIYPILANGRDGDEFYIRAVEVLSVDNYKCLNTSCSYYSNYERNCPGVGDRGFCKSETIGAYVYNGSIFEFSIDRTYTIIEGVNDSLLVNINNYGYESVVIGPVQNCSGDRLSRILTKEISKLDVGGYAECEVSHTNMGEFIIYSGVYADDSTVVIGNNQLARDLNFFDTNGNDISTKYTGSYPASGFTPYSSFKIKSHQISALLDSSDKTEFNFNPFIYNVEGGRRDWLNIGLGAPTKDIRASENDTSGLMNRYYNQINNAGKTIIDFTHPFNASGRITKIYAGVTLDTFTSGEWEQRDGRDENRISTQLSSAKIMFFRPRKNGSMDVLPFEVPIINRNHVAGKLYSSVQEYVELDCDLFVNKGDLIGIYNANVYRGKSISGYEVDALYYQVDGEASGNLNLNQPSGQGSGGLLIYACSEQLQNRLVLEIDLGKRVNVNDIKVTGRSVEEFLEYNVARCLDMNWEVDLFGGNHTTGYIVSYRPLVKAYYNHPNLFYGKNCLNDGIKIVTDGIAADSFNVNYGTSYTDYYAALNSKNGGNGVVPVGAKYFQVNGDCEWLGVYLHVDRDSPFVMPDFENDPIAFTLLFPYGKEKLLYKSKLYFKERYNFRSFGLSTYKGSYLTNGNADDPRFDYIPNRTDGSNTPWTRISLDGIDYTPEDEAAWSNLGLYLAKNPCTGHAIVETVSVGTNKYDPVLDYYSDNPYEYSAYVRITNNDEFIQATATDWSILEHEWTPFRASGFRFYCNHHQSTKLCEFEVFCVVEAMGSSINGSVDVLYSEYGDYWWTTSYNTIEDGVSAFVGDTPKYVNIIIKPITEISLRDILVDVSFSDVFMGDKGCLHSFFPDDTKIGTDNLPQVINFKNVYGKPHDLHVDIVSEFLTDESAIFFSMMNSGASIANPIIGPDAYYKKQPNFELLNYDSNVAINCPVYALKNLVAGTKAWYSHNKEYTWRYWGEITNGKNINFDNLPSARITTLNVPILSRSKWWKIGYFDPRVVTNVREVRIYNDNTEITGINFYHHKSQDAYVGANTDTAPHLNNYLMEGSYYVLKGNHYIGFELPGVIPFNKIVIYHDQLLEYENAHDIAGIDSSTALCITGNQSSIVDYSYFEHATTVIGSGIYIDNRSRPVNYSYSQDFSKWGTISDTFPTVSGINPTTWSGGIDASIVSDRLHIVNSGTGDGGKLESAYYLYEDFDIIIDLEVDGAYSNEDWGCFLEVYTDTGRHLRVGRTYQGGHIFKSQYKIDSSWVDITSLPTSDTTNLKLRVKRVRSTTTLYAQDSVGTWYTLGTSYLISYYYDDQYNLTNTYPVKIKLSSYRNISTVSTTTAMFDNFSVIKSSSEYATYTAAGSSFYVSNEGPTGWAHHFALKCGFIFDGSYMVPHLYLNQSYPLDETCAFTMDFVFNIQSYSGWADLSFGVLGDRWRKSQEYWPRQPYWSGPQIVIAPGGTSVIFVVSNIGNEDVYVYTYNIFYLNTTYYTRITSNGSGNYRCRMWTDAIDGSVKVLDKTLTTSLKWWAGRVGVSSAGTEESSFPTVNGWITNISFTCSKVSSYKKFGNGSVRFSNFAGERLLIDYNNSPTCNIAKDGLNFYNNFFVIDFHIMFNTIPTATNTVITIAKCWDDRQALTDGASVTYPSSWAFTVERASSGAPIYWNFYINGNNVCKRIMNVSFTPNPLRWYHFYFSRGTYGTVPYSAQTDKSACQLLRDGMGMWYDDDILDYYSSGWKTYNIPYSGNNIVIGENLDGWIDEFRISCDYTAGGARGIAYGKNYYDDGLGKAIPTGSYERYYTFSLFDSSDNLFYGKNMDVDTMFDNSYSYHEPFSIWSEKYYSYFAIDLGQRHNLEIIRSYPFDTALTYSLTNNVLYSNKETEDPIEAFALSEEEAVLNTNFEGEPYDYPSNWEKQDTANTSSYILESSFYQLCTPISTQTYCRAKARFHFYGDFDFHIDYRIGSNPNTNSWLVGIKIEDIYSSNRGVMFVRCYEAGANSYKVKVKNDSSTWTDGFVLGTAETQATLRVTRAGNIFQFYVKNVEGSESEFIHLYSYQLTSSSLSYETNLCLMTLSDTTTFPIVSAWWSKFVVSYSEPIFSDYRDARWVRIKLLNGDAVSRSVKNIGIYPKVSVQNNEVGQYNTYWDSLGSAITSYDNAENIALGATISGSSYTGVMFLENAVNGITNSNDFNSCWGSADGELHPWVTVHFNQIESVFRFKIYHGYDGSDSKNLITAYKIQTSTDGVNFTTRFTITGNTSFVRTHDLTTPVSAKMVRLYVDSYNTTDRYVWTADGYKFWSGAVLREIEIYKYYGFTVINSEDNPIIAIDLKQPYFVSSHSLVGVNTEDTTIDWDNSNSNFAWSNSNLTDPSKVTFSDWGTSANYAKWVVVKRNTATSFPTTAYGKDYLKHVIIKASPEGDGGKPNPIEYPWMWRSNISTLSYDYTTITDGDRVNRSLKISYPASDQSEYIRYVEGDHFGIDTGASWRDGFGFMLYIDDISNLDLEYGYFYLGGKDYTSGRYPVVYRWNMTTLSGSLVSGWNDMILTFLYADDITYTELDNPEGRDPRRLYSIDWGTAGLVFRGKGNPLQLNLEELYIKRNYFEHMSNPWHRGLYLHSNDIFKAQVGEMDFHSGTVEFWIRPDWNWDGRDIFDDFKFRTLFHFGSVANDVLGAAVSSQGLEVYYGNLLEDFNLFVVSGFGFNSIDRAFHMAFVFSNDGSGIGSDGSTVRVYINNYLFAKSTTTWTVSDDKHFNFTLGGQGLLVQKMRSFDLTASSVDAVISRLKMYNYCKTDFTDSMSENPSTQRTLLKPSDFIEISKDNLTFHKVGSSELPFFFEQVAVGGEIPVWVKVTLPRDLTGDEKRTSKILGSWDIGV